MEHETLTRVARELDGLPVAEAELAAIRQQVERGLEALRTLDELDLTGVEPPTSYRVV